MVYSITADEILMGYTGTISNTQPSNTLIINLTGTPVDSSNMHSNGIYVTPLYYNNNASNVMGYDSATFEVVDMGPLQPTYGGTPTLQQVLTVGSSTIQTLRMVNVDTSLVTSGKVGIANLTPIHTLDIGSNLYVDDAADNVLTIRGNISAYNIRGDGSGMSNLVTISNLEHITLNGNVTDQTLLFTNSSTAFVTSGKVGIVNPAPTHTLDVGSKFYVSETGSNTVVVQGNVSATQLTLTQMTGGRVPFISPSQQIVDSSSLTFQDGALTVGGDLQVSGNMVVAGNVTYIATENLVVKDSIIEIANNNTAGLLDMGIVMNRPDANVAMGYLATVEELVFAYTQSGASEAVIVPDAANGLVMNVYGNVTAYGFSGEGSLLRNVKTISTFEDVVVNGNTSSNTVIFANLVTSLITLSSVGIQNSAPVHTLDVGANLFVEELGSNVLAVQGNVAATQLTVTTLTSARLPFVSAAGQLVDSANLTFVSNTLLANGILEATDLLISRTDANIHGNVYATAYFGDGQYLTNVAVSTKGFGEVSNIGNASANVIQFVNATTAFVTVSNVGIANTTPVHTLDVGANLFVQELGSNVLEVQGNVSATQLTLTTLTSARLPFVSAAGQLVDSSNLTFVSNTLYANGIIEASDLLISRTDANIHGNVYATAYFGDGQYLSNIEVATKGWDDVSNIGNASANVMQFVNATTAFVTVSNVGIANVAPVHTLDVGANLFVEELGSNVLAVQGNVSASQLTVANLTAGRVTFASAEKQLVDSANLTFGANLLTVVGTVDASDFLLSRGSANVVSNLAVGHAYVGDLSPTRLVYVDVDNKLVDSATLTYTAGTLIVDGNVSISGNLLLTGNVTTVSVENLIVNDPIIEIANNSIDSTIDMGIILHRPIDNVGIIYRGHENELMLGFTQNNATDINVLPDYANNIYVNVYGNVTAYYFSGDGKYLTNVATTSNLDVVTVNGNVSTQTLILSNAATAFVTVSNVGIANVAPIHTLDVGANLFVEDLGSNVLEVQGNVSASQMTISNVTAGRLTFASTAKQLVDSANLTFATNVLTVTGVVNATMSVNTTDVSATANVSASNVYVSSLTPTRFVLVGADSQLADNVEVTYSAGTVTVPKLLVQGDATVTTNVFFSNLTESRVMFVGPSGQVVDSANLTFNVDTLTVVGDITASNISSANLALSSLIEGRMVFSGADGLLVDSANLTFNVDTLTVVGDITASNISSANLTLSSLTQGRMVFSGANGLLVDAANLYVNNEVLYLNKLVVGAEANVTSNLVAGHAYITDLTDTRVVFSGPSGQLTDSTNLTFAEGALTVGGDLRVTGNMEISGNVTYIATENLVVKDSIIEIANNNTAGLLDMGIVMNRPTANVAMGYLATPEELVFAYTQSGASEAVIVPDAANSLVMNVYGNVTAYGFSGEGSLLRNVASISTLETVVINGNVTSNTVIFANAAASFALDASAVYMVMSQNTASLKIGSGDYITPSSRAIAIGSEAGSSNQDYGAIAIGYLAGHSEQREGSVAIGREAGESDQGSAATALGPRAAQDTQGDDAVAVGAEAGRYTQGSGATALGFRAGQSLQSGDTIAVGNRAARFSQGNQAMAVGKNAGYSNQGTQSIALGYEAAYQTQGNVAVAIGWTAGYSFQSANGVAIGARAGYYTQNESGVAIGNRAGESDQGSYSVAIGHYAGFTSQHPNTIILNADVAPLNSVNSNGFYVRPVRDALEEVTMLAYTSDMEIITCNAMTVTSLGFVGIHNTAPTHTLDVGSNLYVDDTGADVVVVTGNVSATAYFGDGQYLSNIEVATKGWDDVSNIGNASANVMQFVNATTAFVTLANVGIANVAPTHTLDVGSNLFVDELGANVLVVTGNMFATAYFGDGQYLTNVAVSTKGFGEVSNIGNTTANVIQFVNATTAFVTVSNVGILNLTPMHTLDVGANLFVEELGSNVLAVQGNVAATQLTVTTLTSARLPFVSAAGQLVDSANLTFVSNTLLANGIIEATDLLISRTDANIHGNVYATAYFGDGQYLTNVDVASKGWDDVSNIGNASANVMQFVNATTAFVTLANVGIANVAPTHTLDVGANLFVEELGSNVLAVQGNVSATQMTVSNLTAGRITFASTEKQLVDSANLTFTETLLTVAGDANVVANLSAGHAYVGDLTDTRVVFAGPSGKLTDSTNLTFAEGTLTVGGDLSVTGNMNITGNVTYIGTENVVINDAIIEIANNNTLGLLDMGIVMNRPTANVAMGYLATPEELVFAYTQSSAGDATIVPDAANGLVMNVYGNVTAYGFSGEGSLLRNVATISTLETVVINGNVTSNTVVFANAAASFALDTQNVFMIMTQNQASLKIGYGERISPSADALAIGNYAGNDTQGLRAVALGLNAGYYFQNAYGVSIGANAGNDTQGFKSIAIGSDAGIFFQGSFGIGIGSEAGASNQGSYSIALGASAGNETMGESSIAMGYEAGQTSQGSFSVAIGIQAGNSSQASNCVAIGSLAAVESQSLYAVAIGDLAGYNAQGLGSIAIGKSAGLTNQGSFAVAIGYSAGMTSQSAQSIILNATTSNLDSATEGFFVAPVRSLLEQSSMVTYTANSEMIISNTVTSSSLGFVGIANVAPIHTLDVGSNLFVEDLGSNVLVVSGNVAATYFSGEGSLLKNTATISTLDTITINGNLTTQTVVFSNLETAFAFDSNIFARSQNVFIRTVNNSSLKVGSGERTNPGYDSVAFGCDAGSLSQGIGGVAFGTGAASNIQGEQALAFGYYAGNELQGNNATAIGSYAGYSNQGQYAVSIGNLAGQQGQGSYAVAIGHGAGDINQHPHSIILNATGSLFSSQDTSAFYVSPVRDMLEQSSALSYTANNEIIRSNAITISSSGAVGIANTTPVHTLDIGSVLAMDVNGSNVLEVTGNLAATRFIGDGSGLTNVIAVVNSNTYAAVSVQYSPDASNVTSNITIDTQGRDLTFANVLFSNANYQNIQIIPANFKEGSQCVVYLENGGTSNISVFNTVESNVQWSSLNNSVFPSVSPSNVVILTLSTPGGYYLMEQKALSFTIGNQKGKRVV